MTNITVRALAESDWQTYRALRLAALREAPGSFVGTYADESQQDDEFWRDRVGQGHRFVAEKDSNLVGVVGLRAHSDNSEEGEVFDLWVTPEARKGRVAKTLVTTAATQAVREGRTRLFFWALSDSGPAIGFASSYGFRPTSERRPSNKDGVDQVAMVLSLAADPHSTPNPSLP